jgi:hypothetical protein
MASEVELFSNVIPLISSSRSAPAGTCHLAADADVAKTPHMIDATRAIRKIATGLGLKGLDLRGFE